MRSYIFNFAACRFERYASEIIGELPLDELLSHTDEGEIIVHIADDGSVHVIEDEKASEWVEYDADGDRVALWVAGRQFFRENF